VRLIELETNDLPLDLDPERSVIFPLIHGDFGEDGQLQTLLEARKFFYVGSDSRSMALTIHKLSTKQRVSAAGISVLPHFFFSAGEKNSLNFGDLCKKLGTEALFLKPDDKGSSLHCHPIHSEEQLQRALEEVVSGNWLLESLCPGREITVAILNGRALEPLEVISDQEFLDYTSKYTPGKSCHLCPAPLDKPLSRQIQEWAERAFARCHCSHWGRVDFLVDRHERPHFLEINGIPGFTPTSFYPDILRASGRSLEGALLEILRSACPSLTFQLP
jgi:D-alanine-D-alanine ligase